MAPRLEAIIQDVGFAARKLRKEKAFSAVVILTLAVGIAANTAIFSLMNPYFYRSLPFGASEELVQVEQLDPIRGYRARLSLPQYLDWRERSRAFADMSAYYYGTSNVTGAEGPERIGVAYLTANTFSVLQAPPRLGRVFLPEEDGPGGADVVVLSHGLWQRRYAGDPGVVGRTIEIDGVAHTVIGVMPEEFNYPFGGIKMWVPMRDDPERVARDRAYALVVGRLAPGWTVDRAREELAGIQEELAEIYPAADGQFAGVVVRPLREALNFAYEVLRLGFAVLLGAVIAVLMIACVNVASLTLARASARNREVAVRVAIGAGRWRIVRQFLTESVMLAVVGGGLGVLLAHWAVRSVNPFLPEDLYRIGEASLDGRVLLFSVIVTLATPLVFGLAPALTATKARLTDALKEGGRGSSGAAGSLRGRRALVVAEVALAVLLIGGAGLMLRSLGELQEVDLGFRSDETLTAEITPPASDYEESERVAAYFEQATRAVAGVPGVRAAATVYPLPLNHETGFLQIARPDQAPAAAEDWPVALHLRAGPGFFAAMGIPLLAGRGFRESDGPESARVAVVSRRLAERLWSGESAVGRTLRVGSPPDDVSAVTVIGVVGDIKHTDIASDNRPQIWEPLTQSSRRRRFIVAHTAGPPGALTGPVREALASVDANLPVSIRPMSEIVLESTYQWAVPSLFLTIFGAVALFLAALGIYGVISYSVARRRREMGIRIALGATARQIRRLVLGEGLRLTAMGLALGLALTIVSGQLISSMLFGISAFDLQTLLGVLVLFALVAAVASVAPAARAARASPHDVLRAE